MPTGMIDRGADLEWLSQYPHEKECLFAPLTGIEVRHKPQSGWVDALNAHAVDALVHTSQSTLPWMDQSMVQQRDRSRACNVNTI